MLNNTYYRFFSNLANDTKMKIVSALHSGEKSVGELCLELGVEQSKISHALSSLKCCSIVRVRQEGKKRIYSLNKDTIVPILKLIDKHEKKFCKICRRNQG